MDIQGPDLKVDLSIFMIIVGICMMHDMETFYTDGQTEKTSKQSTER